LQSTNPEPRQEGAFIVQKLLLLSNDLIAPAVDNETGQVEKRDESVGVESEVGAVA
jgi:hypothetical protein